MRILKAQVYDPYLDGQEDLPVRLELLVTDLDLDEPSHVNDELGWRVFHYGKLMNFEATSPLLEDEDELEINLDGVLTEPIFPVTVSIDGGMWSVMYMRVTIVQRLLKKLEGANWDLLPNPAQAVEFNNMWHLVNMDYYCAGCVRESANEGDEIKYVRGRHIKVSKYLYRTLCTRHAAEHNEKMSERRRDGMADGRDES